MIISKGFYSFLRKDSQDQKLGIKSSILDFVYNIMNFSNFFNKNSYNVNSQKDNKSTEHSYSTYIKRSSTYIYEDYVDWKNGALNESELIFDCNQKLENFKKCDLISSLQKFFNKPLSDINENNLRNFVMDIMGYLYEIGPEAVNVFRKPGSISEIKVLINKIEEGEIIDFESSSVFIITGVLKHFLKNLPDCLLQSSRYEEWMQFHDLSVREEKLKLVQNLLETLPSPNYYVLKHLVCLLQHISENSDVNTMNAQNLGICIEPSCLWPQTEQKDTNYEMRNSGNIFAFLISECTLLFGNDILSLFKHVSNKMKKELDETDFTYKSSQIPNTVSKQSEDYSPIMLKFIIISFFMAIFSKLILNFRE